MHWEIIECVQLINCPHLLLSHSQYSPELNLSGVYLWICCRAQSNFISKAITEYIHKVLMQISI